MAGFGASREELKNIYILYIRSLLEQSCVVWHSALTKKDKCNIERVQKTCLKVILGNEYTHYKTSLEKLNLYTLDERRKLLCVKFAKKCTVNENTKYMFKRRSTLRNTRNQEKYIVTFANTERLKMSAIPYMQRLLNEDKQRSIY